MLTQSNDIERLYDTTYQDINEDLYNALIRQVKTQRDTLNLLHLQRKSQGDQDIETILAEKDRLIFSLQTQVETTIGEGNSQELENEILDLEERVRSKNKKIRDMENNYNLHLNRLTDEITDLKSSPSNPPILEQPVNEISLELQSEVQDSKHQIQFLENQIASLQEMGQSEENQGLHNQVYDLQQKLKVQTIQLETNPQTIQEYEKQLLQSKEKQSMLSKELSLIEKLNLSLKLDLSQMNSSPKLISSDQSSSANTLIELHKVVQSLIKNSEIPSQDQKQLKLVLNELLNENQIEVYNSVGEQVSDLSHQIIDTIYCNDQTHNIIFKELSKGFLHNGSIVQKAQVIVAKNPFYCSECDKVGIKDSKFCFHCGTKLLGTDHLKEIVPSVDDQSNSNSYVELGEAFLNKQEYDQALCAFEKSLKISSNNMAVLGITKTLEAQAKYREALEAFKLFDQNASGKSLKLEIENRISAKIKIVEQLQYLV
ncbi:nucleotide exchange factor GrpE [bacterium]|nr:nucleotide exchange factor GrpE [bacterium]